MSVNIKQLKENGTQFYPETHVEAVVDGNGTTLDSLLSGKQATLVSGTNIKTINNNSLLGSGNITISGGGGAGTLNTTATTAQSTNTSESLSGSITLHKVSKTGTYSDLIGTPTIPAAPGTLNTTATTAQSTSSSEALSGNITLHKVAKTGTYSDLAGRPTIPSAPGTLNTTATSAQSTSSSEALSGSVTLHKVAKTGTYSDLVGKPTVDSAPTASSSNLVSSGGVYTALQSKPNYTHLTDESDMPASPDASTLYLIDDGGSGQYTLPIASASTLGGVKVGSTLSINSTSGEMNVGSSFPKYVLLADEAAYTALATKDSGTLYLIPKTS